ncbi:MAG: hypothetical protein KDB16_09495, partial [Acidimicrobiales bacterium]|nr:hypothetical protein [Acidimicrobiales bacterium]
IDVWGGDSISVGSRGVPQRFVNIVGNVSDEGTVVNLTAQLEGGVARSMRIGPAERRLVQDGDFNVDIPIVELHPGINRVTLVATDNSGLTTTRVVSIDYDPISVRPNMVVDWTQLGSIDEAAHVVDGKWRITNDGIRTAEPGYDRIVSIGHITWESYEVLTSFTVHGITPDHLDQPSNGAGVGIAAHWTGHSSNPDGNNPLVGFLPDADGFVPLGALAWVRWRTAG